MGGTKRQLEEYEEFLINRPPVRMNADTQANILAMTVEATQLEVCLLYTSPSPRDVEECRMAS